MEGLEALGEMKPRHGAGAIGREPDGKPLLGEEAEARIEQLVPVARNLPPAANEHGREHECGKREAYGV